MPVGFDIDVISDIKQAEQYLTSVEREVVPKAASWALNRTAKKVQTRVIRFISSVAGIKQKLIRSEMFLIKSSWTRLTSMIRTRGKPRNIIHWNARQTKKGVTASPWKNRRLFKHAFIVNDKWVAVRTTKKRLPLKPIFGPGVMKEFSRPKAIGLMQVNAIQFFKENFNRELKRHLGN